MLAVMLMIHNLLVSPVTGREECVPIKGNVTFLIPRVKSCMTKEEDAAQRVNITSYAQAHFRERAAFCRTIERTVCTKAFLQILLRVVREDKRHSSVTPQICKQLWEEKKAKVHRIARNLWQSRVPVEYSYGWTGTKCHTTTNYELQEDIVASEDGKQLSEDYGEHKCQVHMGKCIYWQYTTHFLDGEHMKKGCSYQWIGRYEAQAKGTRVLIKKVQASLTFLNEENDIPEACHIKSPRSMDNHLVISIEQNHILKRSVRKKQKKRRGHDTDPENPRLQYLYDW